MCACVCVCVLACVCVKTVLVCLVTYLHSNSIHTRFLSPLNFVCLKRPCSTCGGKTAATGGAAPSPDDSRWGAGRVELHQCTVNPSHVATRFPRYNDPVKLLETRRGRCGEWASIMTHNDSNLRQPFLSLPLFAQARPTAVCLQEGGIMLTMLTCNIVVHLMTHPDAY